MYERLVLHCDRCGRDVEGSRGFGIGMTTGYYDVSDASGWHKFARQFEQVVCDGCMFADPQYIAIYGVHS